MESSKEARTLTHVASEDEEGGRDEGGEAIVRKARRPSLSSSAPQKMWGTRRRSVWKTTIVMKPS